MKINRLLITGIILLFSNSFAFAQQVMTGQADVYGFDPALYNGKQYTMNMPSYVSGHQFLVSPAFDSGIATIKGICYEGLLLNYDCFTQQVVMQFTDKRGGNNYVALSQAWLQSFTIGNKTFIIHNISNDTSFKIYQSIGNGPVQVLYFFKKRMQPSSSVGSRMMEISDAERTKYLSNNGIITEYSSNRGFLRCFEKSRSSSLKQFIRQHHIHVRRASDSQMKQLIDYCNTRNP